MRDELTALIDAQEASAVYDKAEECTVFPNGDHWARCTFWARGVEAKLGSDRVKVMGFSNENNPSAKIAKPLFGHDFAVVDDRYVVDGWVKFVASHLPNQIGVYDMEDEKDAEVVHVLYGNVECWSWLDEPGFRSRI